MPVPTGGRFCGRCGALVRPRTAARPVPPEDPRPPPASPVGATETPVVTTPDPRRRRLVAAAAATTLVAVLVLVAVFRPDPEVVTADGAAGPDGSGRTSTHAATDLTPRWDVAAPGPPAHEPTLTGAYDLGRVFVVTTDAEVIGLLHPEGIAAREPQRDGVNLGGSLDPVRWRLPAVAGVPVLVDGRLPVVADRELLWFSPGDGTILARSELAGEGQGGEGRPSRWAPAFAVPAGELLVTSDGSAATTHEGVLRWQVDTVGEVVGVAGDVVVVAQDRRVVGRSTADGEVQWSRTVATDGHVSARVVDGVVVTTARGGLVEVLDPAAGAVVASGRVGGVPASGRTDGETSIVGTTATEVFVRLDASYGIRYARLRAADAGVVEDLGTLTDRDVRAIQEHDGDLLILLWDGVEVRRAGSVGWVMAVLPRPPAAATGWVVFGEDEFTIASAAGGATSISVPHAPQVPVSRPAVADGLAILRASGGLVGLDLATGDPAWTVDLDDSMCCPSHLVREDAVVLLGPHPMIVGADGTERWRPPSPLTPGAGPTITGIAGDWVVVTDRGDPSPGRSQLRALADGRPGPVLEAGPVREVVSHGSRLSALGRTPDGRTAVVTYDLPALGTGADRLEPRWTRPITGRSQLVRTPTELLVIGAASVLHLDPDTGEERRSTALPSLGLEPAAVGGGHLVRRIDAHTLEGLHLTTGERWTRTFEEPIATAPTIAGDVVHVGDTASVVFALDLADGSTVTSVSVPGPGVRALTVAEGYLLARTPDRLHVLGPATGVSSPGGRPGR